jgi:uncharacterized protein (TIGR03000 family)
MYGVMLATLLGTGGSLPAWDSHETTQALRRAIEELRKDQADQRAESLQREISFLRHRLLEQQLEEIRRDLEWLKHGPGAPVPVAPVAPSPLPYPAGRAVIHLRAPAGAMLTVNDKEVPVPSPNPSFVTPVLEAGREYHYDFAVTVTVDGKTTTRVRRVPVRPGQVVRLTYEEMTPRGAPAP